MSIEQSTLVRRMYAALDAGDVTAVPDLFDPAWVNHDPSLPPLSGHDGARQLFTILTSAFPDFHTTIEEIIEEGDLVAARLTHRGTHRDTFLGVPATGQPAVVTATGIFRVANERLVENWVIFDTLGLLRQLGVIPEPAAA